MNLSTAFGCDGSKELFRRVSPLTFPSPRHIIDLLLSYRMFYILLPRGVKLKLYPCISYE